jgi:hypothetical protein
VVRSDAAETADSKAGGYCRLGFTLSGTLAFWKRGTGSKGTGTREERKAFLLTILAGHAKDGASLGELLALLPELTRRQLQSLLSGLYCPLRQSRNHRHELAKPGMQKLERIQ